MSRWWSKADDLGTCDCAHACVILMLRSREGLGVGVRSRGSTFLSSSALGSGIPSPMIVPLVLLGSLVIFRLLGFLGVPAFSTWQESTAYALAVMFCFTGVTHFGRMRADLERMVPPWVPNPKRVVFVTGLLEILGAIGLIIPETRWLAGICLIAFLVVVFPANVHAAKTDVKLGDKPVTPLWIRGPMQVVFILLLVWVINQ